MPRYLVESRLPGERADAFDIAAIIRDHGRRSAEAGATWLYGYLADDASTLFGVYDARDAETVRIALARDRIPVERIARVHRLDPTAWGATEGVAQHG